MTNYEQLFHHYMSDPQFAQSYYDARVERLVDDMLNILKEKIAHDEPKENILKEIDVIHHQLHLVVDHMSQSTSQKRVVVH